MKKILLIATLVIVSVMPIVASAVGIIGTKIDKLTPRADGWVTIELDFGFTNPAGCAANNGGSTSVDPAGNVEISLVPKSSTDGTPGKYTYGIDLAEAIILAASFNGDDLNIFVSDTECFAFRPVITNIELQK